MDIHRLKLIFHTIRYLKFRQIYYRIFYYFRNKLIKKRYKPSLNLKTSRISWEEGISNPMTFKGGNSYCFCFLNLTKCFQKEIDWNFSEYGKLWTYNLNYFDFLNQEKIDEVIGLQLIEDYLRSQGYLREGLDSYPISLRCINWIKFLSKNNIQHQQINSFLYSDYLRLKDNLEYHLLGNHLLENGLSLLFAAYYFKNEEFYDKSKKILNEELREQILHDGAHFELSPMYHQILLHRLLDCINLIQRNSWKEDNLYFFLKDKAEIMLEWLQTITYSNGDIPMVNDCAYGIAPDSSSLFQYARSLNITFGRAELKECGYRKIIKNCYELFIDVGNIGPDYQPGHAHSDTFSFELYLNNRPLIVDVGTSTYEKNEKRQQERQTSSHNTVVVNNKDQSQIWDGFRVAKRAKVVGLIEDVDRISAIHDGYKSFGVYHKRIFDAGEHIIIQDELLSKSMANLKSKAYFHIHPSLKDVEIKGNQLIINETNTCISFSGAIHEIELTTFAYSLGFNNTVIGKKVCVEFSKKMTTRISI